MRPVRMRDRLVLAFAFVLGALVLAAVTQVGIQTVRAQETGDEALMGAAPESAAPPADAAPEAQAEATESAPKAEAEPGPVKPDEGKQPQGAPPEQPQAGRGPGGPTPAGTPPPAPEPEEPSAAPVDLELEAFRADLARRTGKYDREEMIENEGIFWRNQVQYNYNAIPNHKEVSASCGSSWWREYCGR